MLVGSGPLLIVGPLGIQADGGLTLKCASTISLARGWGVMTHAWFSKFQPRSDTITCIHKPLATKLHGHPNFKEVV